MAITFYNFQTFRHNLSSEEDSLDEWGQRAIETASRSSYDPRVSALWMQRAPLSVEKGVKPFLCPINGCKRGYNYKDGLADHLRESHPEDLVCLATLMKEGKRFPCPVSTCTKGYRTQRGLNEHKGSHLIGTRFFEDQSRVKGYTCPKCTKLFARRVQVQTHLKDHQ